MLFYRWGHWGFAVLSDSSQFTWLISGGTRNLTQEFLPPECSPVGWWLLSSLPLRSQRPVRTPPLEISACPRGWLWMEQRRHGILFRGGQICAHWLWSKCALPHRLAPNLHVKILIVSAMALGGGAFWRCFGLDEDTERCRVIGLMPLKIEEETPERSAFSVWGNREKASVGKPGSKPSPSILVSDVPASRNIYRNKCLLCKLPYLVTVADAD